jgi:hypothetical protein
MPTNKGQMCFGFAIWLLTLWVFLAVTEENIGNQIILVSSLAGLAGGIL